MRTIVKTVAVAVSSVALAGPLNAQQHQPPASPDHMEHRFDDPAASSKAFEDPARDAWQMPAKVIETLGLKDGMAAADIGAGTGYFSMRLAHTVQGLTVYAVDIEPAVVNHLRQRATSEHLQSVVPILAEASSPNLPKPVDLVLIVDTYHHLPDRVSYFRNLRKSLNAGGRVAIIDFRKDSPVGPPVSFRFQVAQIDQEMRQAGFQLDAHHDFLPRQHFLVFR